MPKNELCDINGIWNVPFWQATFFIAGVIVCMTVILFVLLYKVVVWHREKMKVEIPWDRALGELTYLKLCSNSREYTREECYFRLTQIVKIYLSDRYAFPLRSKTDAELKEYLIRWSRMSEKQEKLIRNILLDANEIKFAQVKITQKRMEQDLLWAGQLVKSTIPIKKV